MSVISDYITKEFKSEKSINTLRILTSVLFVLTIIFTTGLLTPNVWDLTALPTFFSNIFILIGQAFNNFFRLFYAGWKVMIKPIYEFLGINYNILPDVMPLSPIGVSADVFFRAFYFGLFQICIVGSVIAFIYFIFNCNSRWAFISFLLLQTTMVLAILTPSIGEIFSYIPAGEWTIIFSYILIIPIIVCLIYTVKYLVKRSSKWVVMIFLFMVFLVFFNSFKGGTNFSAIGASLMAETGLINSWAEQSLIGNPLLFFVGPIVWIALLNMLFLETSFQTAHMYDVLLPSSEREKRLKLQMEELERLAKIKQEKLEQEKKEMLEEGETQSISIRRFFSSAAFDYMREMIEKRKDIEKKQEKKKKEKKTEEEIGEEEEILELDKVNQLFSYIETRYAQDKNAKESLTAKAAAPEMKNLLLSALRGTVIRLTMFILLGLLVISTTNILILIGQPDILNSIELLTREIIIILLLPICLLFPTIGSIIKILKRPKIYREHVEDKELEEIKLKEEEEYKEILKEEQKAEKEKKKKEKEMKKK
ncbi:MAG: hypothetical protein EAX96_12100 [Candidatus Lokiarchaeota archaeon]|nr:hypothetical protein [Candidatus Lokiarchaeota archaeon]